MIIGLMIGLTLEERVVWRVVVEIEIERRRGKKWFDKEMVTYQSGGMTIIPISRPKAQ